MSDTLTIDSLRSAGAFVGKPIRRDIQWVDPQGNDCAGVVYVTPLSYHSAVTDIMAQIENREATADRIAACIVSQDGQPIFQPSDITGVYADGNPVLDDGEPRGALCSSLVYALLDAIGEVSGLGKQKESSPETTNSGTS